MKTHNAVRCSIFEIPARNLDLNSIENLFHNVRCELFKQAKEQKIGKEAYDEYTTRMMATIMDMLKNLIDRTIKSLPDCKKEVTGDILLTCDILLSFYFAWISSETELRLLSF